MQMPAPAARFCLPRRTLVSLGGAAGIDFETREA
jgi:hypothetical protein